MNEQLQDAHLDSIDQQSGNGVYGEPQTIAGKMMARLGGEVLAQLFFMERELSAVRQALDEAGVPATDDNRELPTATRVWYACQLAREHLEAIKEMRQ